MYKYLNKLKNKHFLSLLGNGSMAILNMIVLAIMYRVLSIEDNGKWIFYQTGIIFIDTFRTGLLNTAVVKFYAGATKERGKEVLGSGWSLAILISMFFMLLNIPFLFFLSSFTNEGVKLFFAFLSINLVISIPNVMALCKAQGEQRFDIILYVRLLNNGLFLLFIIVLILLNSVNLMSVVYVNLLAILITGLFVLIRGWSGIKSFSKKSWNCIRDLFHFGKYTVGTSISSSLFKVTDTFIINFMLGPGALAIYNVGQRLMEIVEIPLRSLTATAMPELSAAFNQNKKDEFSFIMKKYIGIVTLGLIPFLCIGFIFADFAIGLIAGGKYQNTEAGNVFRLFITFSLLYPADRFFATAIDAIHKPNLNFLKIIVMLFINLLGDFIGVYATGNVYGIAIATLFPTLFAVLFGYYMLKKSHYVFDFKDAYRLGFLEIKKAIFKKGSGNANTNINSY